MRCMKKKLNNKGAALVLTIIVIAFVSILTTMLLYMATMNYQMKSTVHKTRVSFYGSEIPLEVIRTHIVMSVAEISDIAYEECIRTYSSKANGERLNDYQTIFYTKVQEAWEAKTTNASGTKWDWVYGIEKILEEDMPSPYVVADIHVLKMPTTWNGLDCDGDPDTECTAKYHIALDSSISDTDRLELDTVVVDPLTGETNDRLLLKGIKVYYKQDGFASVINTDYCIIAPGINWSVNNSALVWGTETTVEREDVTLEECVTYINYKKQ